MTGWIVSLNGFLLIGLPYASLSLFIAGLVHRYVHRNRDITAGSTQFLERKVHFWALVPFHYGLLAVLTIHLLALLLPDLIIWWNTNPWRLQFLEVCLGALGFAALTGLLFGVQRRLGHPSLRRRTGALDWIVFGLVGVQVGLGLLVSVFHPWGTSWLSAAAAPYFRSLLLLSPDVSPMVNAPLLVRLHLIFAFILIAALPYTRLIHVLVVPVGYFWRQLIVYRWSAGGRTHGSR